MHADVNACVGEFASMTLVKYDCMAGGSLLERTRLVMAQLLEDLQYCHVSGVAILREWRQANALGPEACMPFVFTSETDAGEGASSSWMEPLERIGRIRKGLSQTPQVWIDAQYAVVRGELRLSWDILDGVFPEGLAENMFAAFEALVRACADRDGIWHEAFPLSVLALPVLYSLTWGGDCSIADMDVAAVIDEFSSTRAEYVCIEDVRGALMWRDVPALVCGASARMCEAGLKPGEGVAILLEKGRWQSIMPFAVKSAGGVCIPLDVESPVERLEEIVRRCGAAMVVTDASLREKAAAFGLPILDVARVNRCAQPCRPGGECGTRASSASSTHRAAPASPREWNCLLPVFSTCAPTWAGWGWGPMTWFSPCRPCNTTCPYRSIWAICCAACARFIPIPACARIPGTGLS